MRIAVSGSRGFIGSALVSSLRSEGHQIHPIVRHAPRPGEIGLDLEHHRLDCSNLDGDDIGAVDIVFHLAGEPITPRRWNGAKRELLRSSRIASTDLIAHAIAAASTQPRVLVTMSASGYYGSRGSEVLTEQSAAGEGFLAELCRAWEAATSPARAVGVRVVHARTGIVIGRDGGLVQRLRPLFRLGLGGRLGDGTQWMSPIALVDEVRALTFVAMTETVSGACNLTSPVPVTNTQFTKAFAAVVHRPALLRVPATALRLALGSRTAEEMALASQRILPVNLQVAGFTFELPHVRDALQAAL